MYEEGLCNKMTLQGQRSASCTVNKVGCGICKAIKSPESHGFSLLEEGEDMAYLKRGVTMRYRVVRA